MGSNFTSIFVRIDVIFLQFFPPPFLPISIQNLTCPSEVLFPLFSDRSSPHSLPQLSRHNELTFGLGLYRRLPCELPSSLLRPLNYLSCYFPSLLHCYLGRVVTQFTDLNDGLVRDNVRRCVLRRWNLSGVVISQSYDAFPSRIRSQNDLRSLPNSRAVCSCDFTHACFTIVLKSSGRFGVCIEF